VRTWRGTTVTVEARGAGADLELWASGEHAGPLPATITPVAGALAVVVPAASPT
jgi:hypothetical protein